MSPKKILNLLGPDSFPELTTERIKSHLQKYRLHAEASRREFLRYFDEALAREAAAAAPSAAPAAPNTAAGPAGPPPRAAPRFGTYPVSFTAGPGGPSTVRDSAVDVESGAHTFEACQRGRRRRAARPPPATGRSAAMGPPEEWAPSAWAARSDGARGEGRLMRDPTCAVGAAEACPFSHAPTPAPTHNQGLSPLPSGSGCGAGVPASGEDGAPQRAAVAEDSALEEVMWALRREPPGDLSSLHVEMQRQMSLHRRLLTRQREQLQQHGARLDEEGEGVEGEWGAPGAKRRRTATSPDRRPPEVGGSAPCPEGGGHSLEGPPQPGPETEAWGLDPVGAGTPALGTPLFGASGPGPGSALLDVDDLFGFLD